MSYVGKMDSLMNCRHSDGSLAWQYHINTHEVVFTTVLYATNVRPLDISVHQLPESIAYVQTNIELVWTISRTAILNFVIASQAAYEPKMIEMVGRVIVEFDFAVVEPYILEDGTLDTSRIHLEMGISTYTPVSNSSLLVFMGKDFLYYIADTPGNVMTEVLKMVRYSNLPSLKGQGVDFKTYCSTYIKRVSCRPAYKIPQDDIQMSNRTSYIVATRD
ncbi:hypothetical protein HOLleu_12971 [Holothuria leucospilota]|uniref:Uncharacterized protein n=1 Tax=Holothuria leucospilota TaxID=206669 RepID=A0A9Q1CBQ3_HOLLE|nr:hypothetical protein HOLleu_12971 [Holothuria leucospilota]